MSRISTIDIGKGDLKKHHIKALVELDVTEARKKIREKKKLFKKISFNSWLIKCISHTDGAPAVRALSKLTKLVESGLRLS